MPEPRRTRQHIASLGHLISGDGYQLDCKCGDWSQRGRHAAPLREAHRAHRVALGEWVKPRKTGPDWADVREAARAAGFTPENRTYGKVHWGRGKHGANGYEHGWVNATQVGDRLRVDLTGPGPLAGPRRTVTLWDPTPAEILTAARLAGLIGGTDA